VQKAGRRQRVAVRDKAAVSRSRLSLFCNPLAVARPFGWSGMQVARCSLARARCLKHTFLTDGFVVQRRACFPLGWPVARETTSTCWSLADGRLLVRLRVRAVRVAVPVVVPWVMTLPFVSEGLSR
jgi:hypothetical protein